MVTPTAVDGVELDSVMSVCEEDAWMKALIALDAEIGGGEMSQSPCGFETPSSSSDGLLDSWMDELLQWSSRKVIMGVRLVRGLHGSWLGQSIWPS